MLALRRGEIHGLVNGFDIERIHAANRRTEVIVDQVEHVSHGVAADDDKPWAGYADAEETLIGVYSHIDDDSFVVRLATAEGNLPAGRRGLQLVEGNGTDTGDFHETSMQRFFMKPPCGDNDWGEKSRPTAPIPW